MHAAAEAPDLQSERRRRRIVTYVYVWFALLVFEGAIRKWLLPQFAQYVYFIRDPVAVVIYLLALRNGAFKPLNPFLAVGVGISMAAVPITLAQSLIGSNPNQLMFAVYGWRNYFWYLPLAFVIASQFRKKDLYRFCNLSVVALILAAPLAVAQFNAPSDSHLNIGAAEDEALQFANLRSANGHIRPAGPFGSVLGMVELTASTCAFALMCWILPRRQRPVRAPLLIGGALAVAASLSVSGSRTMYVHVGVVIGTAMLSGLLMKRPERLLRATTIPLLLAVSFGVLFPLVFPEGYSTITSRWDEAYQSEQSIGINGVFGRFIVELLDFSRVIGDVPIVGYGLGLGSNAAMTLQATSNGVQAIPYVETDWARHMVDLGSIMGLGFIVYRVAFTLWLGRRALKATRRTMNPLPILLFGYVGIQLLYAQISGNGVVNGFCWLYVGLCMAACRYIGDREAVAAVRVSPAMQIGRYPNLMT